MIIGMLGELKCLNYIIRVPISVSN